ncbi:hypothetical protein [Bacillus sp. KH172YL63]|uniref:hypothetical protein n=1 Tax=Bacillus sp. KH172YL63 TaxID=2709784 RepID=UPI0013E47A6E|nr:hypothetical protein [Bacillus sp. KH172YL63]BCB04133.1 hypothetical protein KH172YL63_22660 [Bacillus sp. KH172YL63]
MRNTGVIISSLAVLTFCIVKTIEDAVSYIAIDVSVSLNWFTYALIFAVFLTGVLFILEGRTSKKE